MNKINNIEVNNIVAQEITRAVGGCFLDCNNILWKWVNSEWIGKRSVYTFDLRSKWLEETSHSNIKIYRFGIDADYSEIFRK